MFMFQRTDFDEIHNCSTLRGSLPHWILSQSDKKCRKYRPNYSHAYQHIFQCTDFHATPICNTCI